MTEMKYQLLPPIFNSTCCIGMFLYCPDTCHKDFCFLLKCQIVNPIAQNQNFTLCPVYKSSYHSWEAKIMEAQKHDIC